MIEHYSHLRFSVHVLSTKQEDLGKKKKKAEHSGPAARLSMATSSASPNHPPIMEQVLTPASATVKTTAVVTGQSEAEVAPASPVAPDQQPIEPDQQSSGASREAELLDQQQPISGGQP